MKTLISALVLTFAASTAAVAGDSVIADAGIAASLQMEAPASVQVSGFTGVRDFTNMNSDPSEAGRALTLQSDYSASTQVSGFRGINSGADVIVLEDELGGKGGNF